MRPAAFNVNKNFISGWYIDINLCQEIVDSLESKKILLKADLSGYRNHLYVDLYSLEKGLQEKYLFELEKCRELYYKEYDFLHKTQKVTIQPSTNPNHLVWIQKYNPGKYYSALHCENDGGMLARSKRSIVFMTYLNTLNDEGGTMWPYQNFQSRPEAGLTVFWPAYWTHPHCGLVSKTEKKYIATGWYEFDIK